MKQGFSLIELLISLIIISIIITALVPVLTKKLKVDKMSLQKGSSVVSDCSEIDPECKLCYKNEKCIVCSKTCALNEYLDIENCKCKNCEEVMPNCYSCTKNECLSCKENFKFSADNRSCVSVYISPNADNCAKINAIYIKAAYNGTNGKDLCATKYNMGDGGLPIASGVSVLSVGSGTPIYSNFVTAPTCWKGLTSHKLNKNNERPCTSAVVSDIPYNYESCNRTVCNYKAAELNCSNYSITTEKIKAEDWRLPTIEEIEGWSQNVEYVTKNIGTNGLQLCDRFAGSASPVCHHIDSGCNGASCNFCTPHTFYAQNSKGGTLSKGVIYPISNAGSTSATSVRCVIDKLKEIE